MTERARRAQIVAAAIETIADVGYPKASYRQIAARAGLSSSGLISYHFQNRSELITEVVRDVLGRFAAFVVERVDAHTTVPAQLRAFIGAQLDFLRLHRADMLTLLGIQGEAEIAASEATAYARLVESDHAALAELLREGIRLGDFREFDPEAMALFVFALRDGVLSRLRDAAPAELDTVREELTTMIDNATRSQR
ncbi:TetR/AcrR family transcriptional regulator [Actinoalloteichus hymeniacidonis]|uniref:Transcriptional regulator, TetR family n=1 Tax=Actinoalloteichus hymeniacidonis TaxID=340345 RepID=A0AAC9HN51_9PSEU|nr:TetR family transcriptional regulator [Actinoalloteichus hymeniacidonis]AOS62344.1 transcriptional regulator, TetR family [Actinoalloteichus hymeniacidonis]MBB5909628.1 AcrR family transcriptional regulator [Actinoalloteichus hymeniacidonis]